MPVEASPAPAVYWTPRIMTVAAPESVLSPQSFVPAGQCRSVFLAACIQQRPPGEGGSGRPHQWYSSRSAVQCRAEPSLLPHKGIPIIHTTAFPAPPTHRPSEPPAGAPAALRPQDRYLPSSPVFGKARLETLQLGRGD